MQSNSHVKTFILFCFVEEFCTRHNLPQLDINSGHDMEMFFCANPLLSRVESDTLLEKLLG